MASTPPAARYFPPVDKLMAVRLYALVTPHCPSAFWSCTTVSLICVSI